jgi:pentatricopeptide repeat protein
MHMQVLNACVKGKQWEGAFWVLQQLKKQNIKPSAATYGLVMEVLAASSVSMTFGYICTFY